MTKKFALCFFGVAAGASVAAFTQDTVLEVLGYAPAAQAEVEAESEDEEASAPFADSQNSLAATSAESAKSDNLKTSEKPASPVTPMSESNAESVAAKTAKTAEPDKLPKSRKSNISKKAAPKSMAASSEKSSTATKRETVVVAKPPIPSRFDKAETPSAESKSVSSDAISGQWQVVTAVHGAREMPASKIEKMSLEISKDQLLIRQEDKLEKGTLIIGDPFRIDDVVVTRMEVRSSKSDVPPIQGFYFMQGDLLHMVWASPGDAMPTSLEASDTDSVRKLELTKIQ